MERNVKDKTVIVTGGAQGLGFIIADKFLLNGAKIAIILDIQVDVGNEAISELNKKYGEGRAVLYKCDVTEDLEKVSNDIICTYKTVDVLVNNAGGWSRGDSISKTLKLNTVSLVEWLMKFFEHMRIDKGGNGGTILNMSSVFGFRGAFFVPFYATAKHANLGFTKSKGDPRIFAKSGVRIIAICPGCTRTAAAKVDELYEDDELIKYVKKELLWQDPDAVGEAAVEIFKRADSGTAWMIEGGNPIEQVA